MSASRTSRGGGMGIGGRFALWMTLSLLVVMSLAGFFLLEKSRDALGRATRSVLDRSAALTAREFDHRDAELYEYVKSFVRRYADSADSVPEEDLQEVFQMIRSPGELTYENLETGVEVEAVGSRIVRQDIRFRDESLLPGQAGLLLRLKRVQRNAATDYHGSLLAPADPQGGQGDSLRGLVLLVIAAVIAVGAGVSLVVSSQVTKPLDALASDVRSISHGNLHHRTKVKGGGEVYHLARQIDRMAQSLEEAQDAEIELSVREREQEVAQEVREALLPQSAPEVEGFALADLHVDAEDPGGDFHDFVEAEDGSLTVLVCEVSGRGVPGALVGATARAYLRSGLERGGDLAEILRKVNRQLAQDVRRGMYVTTLCVRISPGSGTVEVACAGHKMPLARYSTTDKALKTFQPDGIALGFDKGPVFDRSLDVVHVPIADGERLILTTTGPARVQNADEEELGEKGFYRLCARVAGHTPEKAVASILSGLESHADGEAFPADVSLVVVSHGA